MFNPQLGNNKCQVRIDKEGQKFVLTQIAKFQAVDHPGKGLRMDGTDPLQLLRKRLRPARGWEGRDGCPIPPRVQAVARVLQAAIRCSYKSAKHPERARKHFGKEYNLKWKTIPRIITQHMASALNVPVTEDKSGGGYLEENLHHLFLLELRSMRLTTFSGELKISFPEAFSYFESMDHLGVFDNCGSDSSNSVGSVVDSDMSELDDNWEDLEEVAEQNIRQMEIVDGADISLIREIALIDFADLRAGSSQHAVMYQLESRIEASSVQSCDSDRLMPIAQVITLPLFDRIFCLILYITTHRNFRTDVEALAQDQAGSGSDSDSDPQRATQAVSTLMEKAGWRKFKLEVGEPQLTKAEITKQVYILLQDVIRQICC